MSREYILAIDQGTTSSRAIIFNRRGQSVSIAQREFRQHYPADGWVEHDPLDIWSSQNAVTAEALAKANLGADNVAAAGITNQRETTLVWDRRTGEPIYNAIVWQDRRTAAECRRMREEGLEDLFSSKTGLRLDPYFSGTKLGWILNNVEGARARAEKGELAFGTVDTWLIWNLTNGKVHATDATNASRTLLYNIHTCEWDDALLEILNIPRQMLPEVRSCSEIYGEIATRHFPGGVPIAGVAGDQHAALFGQACFEKGMAKNTYGTGCFLLMNTGDEIVQSKNNLLTTLAWKIGNSTIYALEGSVFIAGALIQWLRDELGIITTASDCDRLAQRVDNNGGVYIVPAFSGLGAPYWDPCARGTILGLTRGTTRNHICRAAIEAVAFQSADLVRAMEADSGIRLKELRIDGGASISDPLIQFQADILGTTVVRPSCNETTALGAAYLAGLATGYWESVEEVATIWAEDKRVAPKMPDADARRLRLNWQRAVERSRDWIEPEPQG